MANRVIVETDLEPDDVIALAYILCHYDHVVLVVGEGDSRVKRVLAEKLVQSLQESVPQKSLLNKKNIQIIEGFNSTLPYPMKHLDPSWFDFGPFKNEVEDTIRIKEKLHQYYQLYQTFQPNIVYLLKPPREWFAMMMSTNYEKQHEIDLKQVVCYAYGGFNYRALTFPHSSFDHFEKSLNFIGQLASRFKIFYHFSRRAELGHLYQVMYDFSTVLDDNHPFGKFARQITLNWNEHYQDQISALNNNAQQEFSNNRLNTNNKNSKNEANHHASLASSTEIVYADVLCLLPPTSEEGECNLRTTARGYLKDYDLLMLMEPSDGLMNEGPICGFSSIHPEERLTKVKSLLDEFLLKTFPRPSSKL